MATPERRAAARAGARERFKSPRLSVPLSLATIMVGQAALFVSGVAAARLLGPTDRGILAQIALVAGIVTAIGAWGLPLYLTYEISRVPAAAPAAARLARRMLVVQALLAVPVALAAMVLLAGGERLDALAVGSLAIPGLLVQAYALAFLQGGRDFMALNGLRLVAPVLYAAGAALLLAGGIARLEVVAVAWVVANAVAAMLGIRALLPGGRGATSPGRDPAHDVRTRPALTYGLRALLGSISVLDTFRIDQLLIAILLAPAALGLYVVGLAFSNWPRFVGQSIGLVAFPSIAALADRAEARRAMWRYMGWGSAVVAACVVPLVLVVGPATPFLFGEEFAWSAEIGRILVVAGGLAGARKLLTDAARGAGIVRAGSVAEIAGWLGFAAGALLLVVPLGEVGVAWSMLVASAVGLAVLVGQLILMRPSDALLGDNELPSDSYEVLE